MPAQVAPLSLQRQDMNMPVLTIDELHNIESGAWFSKLSQPLRHAILERARVRRLADGEGLATRGSPAEEWCGVARGAVALDQHVLGAHVGPQRPQQPRLRRQDLARGRAASAEERDRHGQRADDGL